MHVLARVGLLPGVLVGLLVGLLHGAGAAWSDDAPNTPIPSAALGYEYLLERAYVPSPFNQEIVDNLWRAWPDTERAVAQAASADERRRMTFARYGLTERPGGTDGKPLQFVVTETGDWHTSCFACHAGQVGDRIIPGLPNNRYAMQSLAEDARRTRQLLGKPLTPADLAAALIPFGGTHGTTNAVVFSMVLLQFRDKDLNVVQPTGRMRFPHHDLDAPPWWHYKKRSWIYMDGFTRRGHRSLMQFLLVPQNTREKVDAYEPDFRHIEAYIESIEAPKWPHALDRELAGRGKVLFDKHCASCHGTYGARETYPEKIVPIEIIGTDRARLDAGTDDERRAYADSWLTGYDPSRVRVHPGGYVAPPLDGIWATAPYLHNGSVPTLWHLLHPEERPAAWKRIHEGYDRERVGMRFEAADRVPRIKDRHEKRYWFDTTRHGKSNVGHDFPARLSLEERRAVLEYLKSL